MSTTFLSVGEWERLLLDVIWQGVVIGGLGWLAAKYAFRQPAARSWTLLITITACLVTPLLSWTVRERGWAWFAAAPVFAYQSDGTVNFYGDQQVADPRVQQAGAIQSNKSMQAADPFSSEQSENVETADQPLDSVSEQSQLSTHDKLASVSTMILPQAAARHALFTAVGAVWSIASMVLILRLTVSALVTSKLLRGAETCEDAEILCAAKAAAMRLGISNVPRVLESKKIRTPMVWALGKICLLVPQQDDDSAPQANWSAAFTHELAHAVRGDGWARLWIELVAIAIPLQPLLWILRRSFHTACEEACDDLAVARGISPVEMAAALTQWMGCASGRAIIAVSGMSSSKARTLRLLALREKPAAELGRLRRWLGVAIGLVLTASLAMAQTKKEGSTEPKPDAPLKTPLNDGSQASSSSTSTDLEKASAEDPLITLYARRIQEETQDFQSATSDESQEKYQKIIKTYQEKIDRRKAELRARGRQESPVPSTQQTSINSIESQYIIEPPDVLEITPIRLVSKHEITIRPLDRVTIDVIGTKLEEPIRGLFKVDSNGEVILGAGYGSVKISGLNRGEAQEAVKTQLEATLANPQVALTIDESREEVGIAGKHLVGPDGTINLGIYGSVKVMGQNVEQARKSVQDKLAAWFTNPVVSLDIAAYNSKVFYIIVEESGGDNIQRFKVTGKDSVLDAVAQIPGLEGMAEAKLWISRPATPGHDEQIIQVNWNDALKGKPDANPQLLPADRLFVSGAHLHAGMPVGGSYRPTVSNNGNAKPDDAHPDSNLSVDFGAPAVVKTVPEAGTTDVDPTLDVISVTFSRNMLDHSWSWCHTTEASFPPSAGDVHYLDNKRTCVMPVKLEPGKTYNIWFNWPTGTAAHNFKDEDGKPATPYLLVFKTKAGGAD